jgi:hypothetical protein
MATLVTIALVLVVTVVVARLLRGFVERSLGARGVHSSLHRQVA